MGKDYTSKQSKPAWFNLDGVRFDAVGGVPLLEMSEMAKVSEEDADSAAGAAAVATFYESLLGKEEYARFRKHCRDHATDSDTLVEIMQDLVQEKSGNFPTESPSPSAPGGEPTSPTYRVLSSSGVSEEPMSPELEAQLREAVGDLPAG